MSLSSPAVCLRATLSLSLSGASGSPLGPATTEVAQRINMSHLITHHTLLLLWSNTHIPLCFPPSFSFPPSSLSLCLFKSLSYRSSLWLCPKWQPIPYSALLWTRAFSEWVIQRQSVRCSSLHLVTVADERAELTRLVGMKEQPGHVTCLRPPAVTQPTVLLFNTQHPPPTRTTGDYNDRLFLHEVKGYIKLRG